MKTSASKRKEIFENVRAIFTLVAIIAVIIGSIFAFIHVNNERKNLSNPYNYTYEEYCVKEGDNLWGIADTYAPKGMDNRQYIKLVYSLNEGLSNNEYLYKGEIITIPVWNK